MSFVTRAATGVLSLILVSALLVAGHWAARAAHSRHQLPAVKAAVSDSIGSRQMPDCKMPSCPAASGPVACGMGCSALSNFACEQPTLSAKTDTQMVIEALAHNAPSASHDPRTLAADQSSRRYPSELIHAYSAHEPAANRSPEQVADTSESSAVPVFPQPLPLPARTNSIPLQPMGPEFPPLGEPPTSAPGGSPNIHSPGPRIIERALPNSSAEEREVWRDTLKDLSPKDVRELMRLRNELGRMPESLFERRVPMGQPPWSQPFPGPSACEPLAPPVDAPSPLPNAERATSRTITSGLNAIAEDQQVLLDNIANANTDGYKRALICSRTIGFSGSMPGNVETRAPLRDGILDMSQGKLRRTDRPLDLAIEGEGFFQLEETRTGQIFYTRFGRFTVNSKGELVLRTSTKELCLRPRVKFSGAECEFEISSDGTLRTPGASATVADTLTSDHRQNPSQRIRIVRLSTTADLVPTNESLFVLRGLPATREQNAVAGAPAAGAVAGRLRQGCLEESNVDVDRELHELERLSRQVHALEMAAQKLPLGPQESFSPPNSPATIPSHFARSLGGDRR
jgi:flagellar basal-body rod protein FlgG